MVALQKVTDSLEEVYKSNVAWPSKIDHTLVLHCSDPWYREATVEFLAHHLVLAQYDVLAVPGGPTVVLQSSLTFTSDRPRVKLLAERHQITRFVGIGHLNCSHYRGRWPSLDDQARRKKQEEDLREFGRIIRNFVPSVVEVQLYFAEQIEGRVRFLIVR